MEFAWLGMFLKWDPWVVATLGQETTMSRMAEWPVYVGEISHENRRARVSWNGNAPE